MENERSENASNNQYDFLDWEERQKDWQEVEILIMEYKKQFPTEDNPTLIDKEQIDKSKKAASELLQRFSPLFKKYTTLLKSGQIDFDDKEMKSFVSSFIEEPRLQRALKRQKQKSEFRNDIYKKFNFIRETYGSIPEEELLIDLQSVFLIIARRYKQMGKNFCAYLYNSYKHEISRHIKKFTKNPINITYKNIEYEDYANGQEDMVVENSYEDTCYEDATGMPDFTWISGRNCSEIFMQFSPLERKILIKYYLEEWNDRQIADEFGIHINTVNQKRRSAVNKLAGELKIEQDEIKRNRRSGKKAIMPIK